MQILVLGMHRSGTSATARIINMMGAYFGPKNLAISGPDNPKGHWERRDIMNINDALLALQGCNWRNVATWRLGYAPITTDALHLSMRKIISECDLHQPWFIKDPRLCLTLPAWREFLETPVAVIVHRHPLEIAVSLKTRNFIPIPYGIALWEYHAVGLLRASQHIPRIFVPHAELLARPVKTCEALHAQLTTQGVTGLSMPTTQEIRAFIDPALYRSKPEHDMALSPAQQALSDMIQGIRPQTGEVSVSDASRTIMQAGLA